MPTRWRCCPRCPVALKSAPASRYTVVYDIEGPRVRLGILWFFATVVAVAAGPLGVAVLYGVAAAAAAMQAARTWKATKRQPTRLLAGATAAALALGAALSSGVLGLVCLAAAGAAFFAGSALADRRTSPFALAGYVLQCAFFPGLAAACVVLTTDYEIGAGLTLVLYAAAYEAGDYIVGTGASNALEGPLAGVAVILVMSLVVSAFSVPPYELPGAFVFGALAAVLCPLGQFAASAILPGPDAPAPALRRIDSMLVLAPAWALATGLYIN
jgi:hypothetical protein